MVLRGGIVLLLIVVLGMFVPMAALASVRITEIMYNAPGNDTDREYVVVQNVGSSAVRLTDLRFSSRGDKPDHRLRQGVGSPVLQPGRQVVIVSRPDRFLQHYAYQGAVLDSGNFSLLNSGAAVSLRRNGVALHTVAYTKHDGAYGDGNALHVQGNNAFIARKPSIIPLQREEETRDAVAAAVFAAEKEKPLHVQQEKEISAHTILLFWFAVVVGVLVLLITPIFLADREDA